MSKARKAQLVRKHLGGRDELELAEEQRQLHEAGHPAALIHEVEYAIHRASKAVDEDPLVDPEGTGTIPPHWPVHVPFWACDALYKILLERLKRAEVKRGRKTRSGLSPGVAADLVHLHRHGAVQAAIQDRRAKWGPAADPNSVYAVVSRDLEDTAFAAEPSGIQKSYEVVTRAVMTAKGRARFTISGHRDLQLYWTLLGRRD